MLPGSRTAEHDFGDPMRCDVARFGFSPSFAAPICSCSHASSSVSRQSANWYGVIHETSRPRSGQIDSSTAGVRFDGTRESVRFVSVGRGQYVPTSAVFDLPPHWQNHVGSASRFPDQSGDSWRICKTMRLLIYETKSSCFVAALDIPSSVQVSRLERAAPEFCAYVFGPDREDDELYRVPASKLRQLGTEYLENHAEQKKTRSPKSVHVERDGEVIRGPAKGLTGFSIDGLFSSASVRGDSVTIRSYCKRTDSFAESKIHCDAFPVDDAVLRVNYSSASGAYTFAMQLTQSLSKIRRKFVWLQIEY